MNNKKYIKISLLIVVFVLFVGVGLAEAANITYNSDTIVDLSSPDINLTILSGSVATSVTVNTGNVVVTVPESGVFTITSSDRSFDFSGETQFGVITNTCTAPSFATLKITAPSGVAQTITITPGSNPCPLGGGGGGGVISPSATSTSPSLFSKPSSTLENFVPVPVTKVTPNVSNEKIVSNSSIAKFTKPFMPTNLVKTEVKNLQRALNNTLRTSLARPLWVDGNWGEKTSNAIKIFQKKHGLEVDGIVGPKTREILNKLLGL